VTVADNKRAVLRSIETLWTHKDLEKLSSYLTPAFVSHRRVVARSAAGTLGPTRPVHGGPGDFIRAMDELVIAFPDAACAVDDIFGETDRIALRWTLVGTHRSSHFGVPPTGKPITWRGATILRMDADGKMAESWTYSDDVSLLIQLGALARR